MTMKEVGSSAEPVSTQNEASGDQGSPDASGGAEQSGEWDESRETKDSGVWRYRK